MGFTTIQDLTVARAPKFPKDKQRSSRETVLGKGTKKGGTREFADAARCYVVR
jgi:hypothetical protein